MTIYNSEIAEQDIRGRLSNAFTIVKLIAHFIILAIGPFVSYTVLAIVCAMFPLICICSFYFMPESPYYLVKVGDIPSAKENINKLSSKIEKEARRKDRLLEIENTIQNDMVNKTSFFEFPLNPLYRKSLFIMTGKIHIY